MQTASCQVACRFTYNQFSVNACRCWPNRLRLAAFCLEMQSLPRLLQPRIASARQLCLMSIDPYCCSTVLKPCSPCPCRH